MDIAAILSILAIVIGGGGLAAVITAIYTRRKILADAEKTEIDAAQVLSAASVALLEPMQQQISILNTQLNNSRAKADEMDERLVVANRALDAAQRRIDHLTETVASLTIQLQYYRDRYGPTTDELRFQREQEARDVDSQ